MALFIEVEVAASVAADAELVKKLAEVCPVNIFAAADDGKLKIVDKNLDECTLCELCLHAAPPESVRVKRLYGNGGVLQRAA